MVPMMCRMKENEMKRLLILIVLVLAGCNENEQAVTNTKQIVQVPEQPTKKKLEKEGFSDGNLEATASKLDETADPVAALEKMGAKIYRTLGSEVDVVDLRDTQITDAGLKHLKGMTKLIGLHLNGTSITDAGLVHLKELTNLKALYIAETQVTDMGIAELRKALPNCTIIDFIVNLR